MVKQVIKKLGTLQRRLFCAAGVFIVVFLLCIPDGGKGMGTVEAGKFVRISGEVLEVEDVSAVAKINSLLVHRFR